MYRFLAAVLLATLGLTSVARAEECTATVYEGLVVEAKNADNNRQWNRSVELHRLLLDDCRSRLEGGELVKVYDALAVGLLMQEQYTAAIDTAKNCLAEDSRYNACMMTAAKAYENLGDREMAMQFAREAIEIGAYDDYSAAVVIYAKDFLKKLEKK